MRYCRKKRKKSPLICGTVVRKEKKPAHTRNYRKKRKKNPLIRDNAERKEKEFAHSRPVRIKSKSTKKQKEGIYYDKSSDNTNESTIQSGSRWKFTTTG